MTPCWHCGQALHINKAGELVFTEYQDPIGNKHKLHKECAKHSAYKPPITAQESKGKDDDR